MGEPTDPSQRSSRWLHWWPLPAVALVAGVVALTPAYERMAAALHDAEQRLVAREQHAETALVLDIDEPSLQHLQSYFGSWPLKRDAYALVLDYLREAGARVVAFDIVFADAREGDAAFGRAIAGASGVVLAAGGLREAPAAKAADTALLARLAWPAPATASATDWAAFTLPAPGLLDAGAATPGVGLISIQVDADGVVRGLPLLHRSGPALLPSLSLAALAAGGVKLPLESADGGLRMGARAWPLDARGQAMLVFPSNSDAVAVLPFHEVALAALGAADKPALRAQLRGRAVFIGSSAMLADSVLTPLGLRSGTSLLAWGYEALEHGRLVRPPRLGLDALLLLIACLPLLLIGLRPQERLGSLLLATVAALAVVLAADLGLLAFAQQQVNAALPLVVLGLGVLAGAWHYQHSLRVANRELAYRKAVADAANRAKGEFLASMSHEIRTPLNALLGMAELLAETPLANEQRRYVDIFQSAGRTLLELVNELLDVSKIEAGQIDIETAPFSLAALLAEQRSLLGPRANARGLNFDVALDPAVSDLVLGDRKRVRQVIVNLVGNAIKFTATGSVALRVEREPGLQGLMHFTVQDTGTGIAEDRLAAIFEPYTQADGQTYLNYGGTGLGLTISQRLAKSLGGRIWVESRLGVGSTFHFTADLPDAGELELALADAPPAEPAPAAAGLQPALTLLLVEDHPHNVALIEAMLKDGGHRIDVAGSGEAALEKFERQPYDLVLMDVQMPGMDGYAATREMRHVERLTQRERTPIIAVTANALPSDERLSAEAGCDAHLAKPIRKAVLLQALARHGPAQTRVPSLVSALRAVPAVPERSAAPLPDAALAGLERSGLFDLDAAIERLGGNRDLLQRFLAALLPELGGWGERFAGALAAGDRPLAQRLAHDLKGLAATAGAQALADRASALDAALRADEPANEARLQADVGAALHPVVEALRRAVEGP